MPRRGKNIKYSRISGGSGTGLLGPQFWVSQAGGGTGLTQASPIKMNLVWALVSPVRNQSPVVNLLDGTYTGATSMIQPPATLFGNAGSYITVQALNDGNVNIDGGNANNPILLQQGSDYFRIQGLNAYRGDLSEGAVVSVGSSYNFFSRCVFWDASDTWNKHVISFSGPSSDFWGTHCNNNVVEDCAAFGDGRKQIEFFNTAGPNTIRRFYGRWENNMNTGPKRCCQTNYHSGNLIVDNAIFQVQNRLPASYDLLNNGAIFCNGSCSGGTVIGPPGLGPCGGGSTSCQYPGASGLLINEPDGWIGESVYTAVDDGANVNGNDLISGCLMLNNGLAYACGGKAAMAFTQYGNQTLKDMFVYLPGVTDANSGQNAVGFTLSALANDGAGHTASQCFLTNATSICPGFASDSASAKYTVTNKISGASLAGVGLQVYTGDDTKETLYSGTSGAKLRYRYQNGTLTGTPLWPWPMSDRIKAATTLASTDGHGHAIVDINAAVQAAFGTFPVS